MTNLTPTDTCPICYHPLSNYCTTHCNQVMKSNDTETRIVRDTATNLLRQRKQTKLVTKFKSPSLVRADEQPPTQYTQVEHHISHTHLVKLDQDWLSIVALPSFISLLMLTLLAFIGMGTHQPPTPRLPVQDTTITTGN